jgi:hypothetical protein
MADQKISQLSSASTPLAGTEVLPIVQGGSTVKVSVANLTAGRAITATSIQFADGSALTNSLLNDYEVGTYTPTDQSGAGLTFTFARASVYTKIGNLVNVQIDLTFPSTVSAAGVSISLPFTNTNFYSGTVLTENGGYGSVLISEVGNGSTFGINNAATNAGLTNANLSGKRLIFNIFYRANF